MQKIQLLWIGVNCSCSIALSINLKHYVKLTLFYSYFYGVNAIGDIDNFIICIIIINRVHTAESFGSESVFSTKSGQTAIQQSHSINLLLTSFTWNVRESIAFGFYLRQLFPVQTSHLINKSLINTKRYETLKFPLFQNELGDNFVTAYKLKKLGKLQSKLDGYVEHIITVKIFYCMICPTRSWQLSTLRALLRSEKRDLIDYLISR